MSNTDHADLIARATRIVAGFAQNGMVAHHDAVHLVAAALQSQPAPLVADSREALSRALFDIDNAGGTLYTYALAGKLLASGVVSVAGDRDRAAAERAWDEGYRQGWADRHEDAQAGYVPSGFQQDTPNHYRESEARND